MNQPQDPIPIPYKIGAITVDIETIACILLFNALQTWELDE